MNPAARIDALHGGSVLPVKAFDAKSVDPQLPK